MDDETAVSSSDAHTLAFHNTVREYVLVFVLLLLLMVVSAVLIGRLVCHSAWPSHEPPPPRVEADELAVRRVVLLVCTLSLALALAAALLLPAAVGAHRLHGLWASSRLWHWLSGGLLQSLWRHVFSLSHVCLFMLLPFAHLLAESEGCSGWGKGLTARVCETCTVLCLLVCMVVGAAYLVSAVMATPHAAGLFTGLYSLLSACGVLCLLLCTPLGFARVFDVVARLLCGPSSTASAIADHQRLKQLLTAAQLQLHVLNCRSTWRPRDQYQLKPLLTDREVCDDILLAREQLAGIQRQLSLSRVRRYVGYPLVMCCLLTLTVVATLMVVKNTLELIVGLKALPISTQQATLALSEQLPVVVGVAGAVLEVLVIVYLLLASLVGVYSVPVLGRLVPRVGATPPPLLIANCALLLLVASSSLPLLVRTLGITELDLLASYGHAVWLGHLPSVLLYNLVFAGATVAALTTRATASVRHALLVRAAAVVAAARAAFSAVTGTGAVAGVVSVPAGPDHSTTAGSVLRVRFNNSSSGDGSTTAAGQNGAGATACF